MSIKGKQLKLAVADVAKTVDGLEMGVTRDGKIYFTGHGLAELCGVAISTIQNQRDQWSSGKRDNKLARMLEAEGYDEQELYLRIFHQTTWAHAYNETVSMAALRYYAETGNPIAIKNLGRLAKAGMRMFVLTALGLQVQIVPPQPADVRKFHARILAVVAPPGFFCVFQESSPLAVKAMQLGVPNDEHTVPDISIGIAWANYWKANNLAAKYGERQYSEHSYPDGFPQAKSNPQQICVYPMLALGEFRTWLANIYTPTQFPKYLDGKVAKGLVSPAAAKALVAPPAPANLTRKRGA